MCTHYSDRRSLQNVDFDVDDLETLKRPANYDLLSCITVLQYIENDQAVLARFFSTLKPGGRLLLYVPVNYRRVFPFYEKLKHTVFKRMNYDAIQAIQHKYTDSEICDRVQEAGFEIQTRLFTYGFAGKLSFEIHSMAMMIIQSMPFLLVPPIVLAYLLILFPFNLLLMLIDSRLRPSTGNGLLLIARKPMN
jgi:2-polyprenyl-3-methyl-5-hydroxy-6-metoxy-1,4-benzoquinol methylase